MVLNHAGFDGDGWGGVEGLKSAEVCVGDAQGADLVGDKGLEGLPGEKGLGKRREGGVQDEAINVGCIGCGCG